MTSHDAAFPAAIPRPGIGWWSRLIRAVRLASGERRIARKLVLGSRELHALEDHMLRDIGLTRDGIVEALRTSAAREREALRRLVG